MITSLKTHDGFIYALLEWEPIGDDKILIRYAWIHDNHRSNGAIPSMVRMMVANKIKDNIQKTQFVGWERGEKGKAFRWYPVHRILRRM